LIFMKVLMPVALCLPISKNLLSLVKSYYLL
jgi:hypothetical protein